jgi:hypothetical protein
VDAKTKESTRKAEEKMDGRNKGGHALKVSGKKGSNGVYVSDNIEKRFETDIHTKMCKIHMTAHLCCMFTT